jgi:hypothetical protein
MRKLDKLAVYGLTALFIASCSVKESTDSPLSDTPVNDAVLQVSLKGAEQAGPASRTALQSDWKVFWEENDPIAVLGASGSHSFKADAGGSATTSFSGSLAEDTALYAVYPEGAFSSRAENVITLEIPNLQRPVIDGFDRNAAVCVGKVDGGDVTLQHIVGLIRFTLASDNITSVSICNASGIKMAGTVAVTVPVSGDPAVSSATLDHLLILPAAGETFAAGTYYAAVAPSALTGGIQFMFTRSSDDSIASKVGASPVTFSQGTIMNFGTVDNALSWTPMTKIMMNFAAVDGSGDLVKDGDGKFSFVNPFEYPDAFSTGYKTGTLKDVDAVLVADETSGHFRFPSHSKMGFVQNSSMCFRWGRGEDSYISIPKIAGMTLKAVRLTFGGNVTTPYAHGHVGIATGSGDINGGSSYNTAFTYGSSPIWHMVNPDASLQYRMKTYSAGDTQQDEVCVARWEFFYTGSPESTILDIYCSAKADSETSATFSAGFSTLSDALTYTCGFEYKKASEAVWTNLDATAKMSFTATADALEAGTEYRVRSWVNDGSGKVYSEVKDFSTPVITEIVFDLSDSGSNYDYPLYEVPNACPDPPTAIDRDIPFVNKSGEHYCMTLFFRGTKSERDVYWNGEKQGLHLLQSKDSYVSTPQINGLTLCSIKSTLVTGTTGSSFVQLYNEKGETVSDKVSWSDALGWEEKQLTISSALTEGKQYFLYFSKGQTGKTNQIIGSIKFYYTGTPTATVQYVCPPSYSAGTVSSLVYVNSVTQSSNLSSGFEYKAGGAGEFTALAAGGLSSLTDGKTTASASASLSAGDVVRAWVSVDGGTTKVYSPEKVIE